MKEKDENGTMTARRNSRRMKTFIGILLLLSLAYFVLTNFDLADWPGMGLVIQGPSSTCVETRGPNVLTDTVIYQLKVEDKGFEAMRDRNRAVISVKNDDNRSGDVRVTLYCRNGDGQGDDTKKIAAGDTETFIFEDVKDCDLDYIIEPETFTTRVNRTVYVSESKCE
jgi:hypothetical protein